MDEGGIFDEAAAAGQSAPAPAQGMAGAPAAPTAGPGAADGFGAESEPATPEEQAELERVVTAAAKLVYENDKSSDAVADAITKGDKVGSAIQASLMIFTQVDKSLDIDEVVIPQALMEMVEMVIDAGEQKNGLQFSDEESEAVLAGSWEGVVYMLGGDDEIAPDFAEMTAGMSDADIANMQAMYQQKLGKAQAARETSMSGMQQQPAGPQQMGGQPNG